MVVPKTISEDDTLLSPTEVANELGVHRSTVHNWIRDGMLKSNKHGNFHAVSRVEIHRFSQIYQIVDEPPKRNDKKKSRKKKRKKK